MDVSIDSRIEIINRAGLDLTPALGELRKID